MRVRKLCLFHQGLVKTREALRPSGCYKCLETVLRGRAPAEQIDEVLRDSELWAEEEAALS